MHICDIIKIQYDGRTYVLTGRRKEIYLIGSSMPQRRGEQVRKHLYFLTSSTSSLCFLTCTTFYENISILIFRVGTGLKILFFKSSNKQADKCQFLHKMLLSLNMKKGIMLTLLISYAPCGLRLFKSKSNQKQARSLCNTNLLTMILQRKRI